MGRSKKNKRHWKPNPANPNKRKKGKTERFWIEDCQDTELPDDCSGRKVIDVMITRVELEDNYQQGSTAGSVTTQNRNGGKTDSKVDIPQVETITQPKEEGKPEAIATVPSKECDDQLVSGLKAAEPEGCPSRSSDIAPKKEVEIKTEDATGTMKEEAKKHDGEDVSLIMIKRAKSAKRKIEKFFANVKNFKPLPGGDCGDGIKNPYPKTEVPDKFWSQRKRLFTLFDEGIQLDKESWYSVTPEVIANHIAASMVANRQKVPVTILDLFCGCGGNSIAFAKREEVHTVVCVDNDIGKLKKAAHNALCYGIPKNKIIFVHSSACAVLSCYSGGELSPACDRQKNHFSLDNQEPVYYKIGGLDILPNAIDMAFVSPPWGGMDYVKVGKRNYTLNCISIEEDDETIDGEELLERASAALGHVPTVLFLPKNVNGASVSTTVVKAGFDGTIILEQNVLNGKLKTVTAYFGFD